MVRHASLERVYLADACSSMRLLAAPDYSTDSIHVRAKFDNWLERESRTRTGLMIWVGIRPFPYPSCLSSPSNAVQILYCISAYEFGFKNLMVLDDLRVPLPLLEDVWDNPTSGGTVTPQSCKSAICL
jgi:hypothetical protein